MHINAGDTAWMLTSTALVFFMMPGLALFYGGLAGAKNVIAMMVQSFVAIGLISLLWVIVGYSLAFGADHWGGIIGSLHNVMLHDVNAQDRICSLAPLAIDPDHQRRDIGGALTRAVIARVDDAGEPLIVLEGHPEYYPRFGFEPAAPLGIHIELPSWAPPDAAQVRRLRAYDPSIRGRVVYPPAFDVAAEH